MVFKNCKKHLALIPQLAGMGLPEVADFARNFAVMVRVQGPVSFIHPVCVSRRIFIYLFNY